MWLSMYWASPSLTNPLIQAGERATMNSLDGQLAIVTGGARGIGAAICARLAADGADIVVLDRDAELAEQSVRSLPTKALGVGCDVTQADEVDRAIDTVTERYGRIDILVSNAGVTRDAMFYKMTREDWDLVLATHLTGTFLIGQKAAVHMVERRYGRMIFISSRAALGNRGQANYSAAKAGLQGMAKTLAIELGPLGITVNVVAPGFIETDMTRSIVERTGQAWDSLVEAMTSRAAVRRIGQPADIAAAVNFFAQPEAGFLTGQTLYATGSPAV